MIVYCDTSFLVSFLNEADVNHRAARDMAAKHRTAEFVVCEVKERHTAFHLWHLAAAWALSAGVFLTFDKRQKRIAGQLGMA
jgi:predicted nucleic acid-binding protein